MERSSLLRISILGITISLSIFSWLVAECNQEIFVHLKEDWSYEPGICDKFAKEWVVGHFCDDFKDIKEVADPETGKIGCKMFCVCDTDKSHVFREVNL